MAVRHRDSTICVLGGSGFVGRSLIAMLVANGYRVTVPTRAPARHRDLWVLPGVARPRTNVHDEAELERVVQGSSAVVNLIGILNARRRDGADFEYVHAQLAAKVARACRSAGVPRLLQMSALKADARHAPSQYLRSKGRAEETIAAAGDLVATIFRPSTIFGPDDSFTQRFARLLKLSWLLPLPRGDARFAPVYVEDVAAAFLRALDDSGTHGRTYELCGPEIYSLEEIVRLIARTLGRRRVIWSVPDGIARLQAWVGEYLPGKPFTLDNYRSLGVASVCAEDGLKALGIEPRALSVLLPAYLGEASRQARLASFRRAIRH